MFGKKENAHIPKNAQNTKYMFHLLFGLNIFKPD